VGGGGGGKDVESQSLLKIKNSQLIHLYTVSAAGNAKPQVALGIENIRIMHNYLIPYLAKIPVFFAKRHKKPLKN